MKLYGNFQRVGGLGKKSLPLGWMDFFCNYTLQKVTCDVQFFNLLSPASVHVILLAKCQQLGRCLADNTKKRPKSEIIEINSKSLIASKMSVKTKQFQ